MTSLNSAGSGVPTALVHNARIRSSKRRDSTGQGSHANRNVSKNPTLRLCVRYSTYCRGTKRDKIAPGCYLPRGSGALSMEAGKLRGSNEGNLSVTLDLAKQKLRDMLPFCR
jgi:hypothetical protein